MRFNILVFLILSIVLKNDAARILAMFPTPSISHQIVFRPLIQELAKRGHEVVVITTDPAFPKGKAPANLTEIDVHDFSYKIWRESFLQTVTGSKGDYVYQMKTIFKALFYIFEKQITNKEVQSILQDKSRGFDLLILEALSRQALGLSHVFKAPIIQMSSFSTMPGNREIIGAPAHPLLYPEMTRQRLYNLTWYDKISEMYSSTQYNKMIDEIEVKEDEALKKLFGPDIPPISELKNRVDMLFLNIHPIWEGNFPVPPGVIYTGGLHQNPEKELPKDLKSYLDSSVNGVIYMSFGTNTKPSILPPEKIQTFVRVLSKLPYDVLWKWDKDILPGQSKNIKISKWFPQSDLLKHPKVKLFITQGGLQSTDEALTAGVPLVGLPMLGDQWYNVEKYVYHKIGVQLDLQTMTDETFESAIETVIHDESYRRNVKALNVLLHDQPQKPLDRAVWWTEYVLRHGGARHLRSPAANITWWQFLEVELVLTLLLALLALAFVLVSVPYLLFKYFFNNVFSVKMKRS